MEEEEKELVTKVKRKYTVGPDVDLRREVVRLKDGTRLTNARAAKMAKDAIKQAVGRPSLTAKSVESPQIKVRVPVKLKKALDKEAKRRGETNSAIVREAPSQGVFIAGSLPVLRNSSDKCGSIDRIDPFKGFEIEGLI